jgi:hypothetical protein
MEKSSVIFGNVRTERNKTGLVILEFFMSPGLFTAIETPENCTKGILAEWRLRRWRGERFTRISSINGRW